MERSYAAVVAGNNDESSAIKQQDPDPESDAVRDREGDEEAGEREPLLPKLQEPDSDAQQYEEATSSPHDEPISPIPSRTLEIINLIIYFIFALLGLLTLYLLIRAIVLPPPEDDKTKLDWGKTLKKALGGGVSGAAAMVLQVLTLMPLRTIMNYQYRFGTSTTQAARTLYADGGYGRYYSGLGAALFQGPLSRFGDTFSNVLVLLLLSRSELPSLIKTVFVSLGAASFRMVLTPIDTLKTTLQARGKGGWGVLRRRIKTNGIGTLWYGALATAAATFVGNYPWFGTYNLLQSNWPVPTDLLPRLLRQATIGFIASVISDSVSNSLRVVKTYRQVSDGKVGYTEAASIIVSTEGIKGLLGRGLKTRILTNGLQGLMFSVLWKVFQDLWDKETKSGSGMI